MMEQNLRDQSSPEPLDPPPAAVCPSCRRNTILVERLSLFTVERRGKGHFHVGQSFGDAPLPDRCSAFCNASGCDWTGTLRDAIDAAKGTVESTRGRFRTWIKDDQIVA